MSETEGPGPGRTRLIEILLSGLGGKRPAVPVEPRRLASEARHQMSGEGWAYVAGSAGRESTARANRRAFDRWRILPRMLRDVSSRDLTVELFGERLPAPLLLAPVGVLEMAHREADLAAARAAAAEGVPMIFSSQASVPMEDCAAAMDMVGRASGADMVGRASGADMVGRASGADMVGRASGATGEAPRWFQLYWGTSDELAKSFVERAERCGCRAIVLTVDTATLGWRPRDLDYAYLPFLHGQGLAQYLSDPVFQKSLDEPLPESGGGVRPRIGPAAVGAFLAQLRRYPGSLGEKLSGRPRAAVERFLATFSRPSLVWDDVARLKEMTSLPVVVKGILAADDARLAQEHGADGIIVSNHGGRQVDGSVGALDVLPGVVEAVGGALPVLFDSGVRCGADVVKALALGATAVCLGRPYVYGLAIAGEEGVREVIKNLVAELDLTLALCGCRAAAELGRDLLVEER